MRKGLSFANYPFTLIVQGFFTLLRLAPTPQFLEKMTGFIFDLHFQFKFKYGRLLGFIGPVPPPTQDKRIRIVLDDTVTI